MSQFVEIAIVFFLCSFAGWLLEVGYRSIRLKKWINPGFLTGCCLPIYGTGGLVLYLISGIRFPGIDSGWVRFLLLVLIATVVMTLIEFLAGLWLLKFYHTRLWDYTTRRGNVMGVICPLFTAIWGVISAAFLAGAAAPLHRLTAAVRGNSAVILLVGACLGVFCIDLAMSCNLMAKIRAYAGRIKSVIDMETLHSSVRTRLAERRKRSAAFMFRLHAGIRSYIAEKMAEREEKDAGGETKEK